jgi:tRNA pseudouridine31 synthase
MMKRIQIRSVLRYQSTVVPNRLFKVSNSATKIKEDRIIPENIPKIEPKLNPPIFYYKNGYQYVEPYTKPIYTTVTKLNKKEPLTVLKFFENSFIAKNLEFYEKQINEKNLWILRPIYDVKSGKNKKIDLEECDIIEGPELFELELQVNDIIANYACIHELKVPRIDDIEIIHEDKDTLVVNKPAGIPVHPSGMAYKFNSLQFLLLLKKYGTSEINNFIDSETLEIKPNLWPCHRIDKDTTGVLIFAKTPQKNAEFNKIIESKNGVVKKYIALVNGNFGKKIRISKHPVINVDVAKRYENGGVGKAEYAKSEFQRIIYNEESDTSLVLCTIHTGRKHQLRQHLRNLDFHIVNDPLYGINGILKEPMFQIPKRQDFNKFRREYNLQLENRTKNWEIENQCSNCYHVTYNDPTANTEQSMYLHSWKYEYQPKGSDEPVWSFTAPFPKWVHNALPEDIREHLELYGKIPEKPVPEWKRVMVEEKEKKKAERKAKKERKMEKIKELKGL